MRIPAIILFAAFLFTSCAKDDEGPADPSPAGFLPMPLKVGNRWVYKFTDGSRDTLRIAGSKVIEGTTVYIDNEGWRWFYRDGALMMVPNDAISSATTIFAKDPPLGFSWGVDNSNTLESKNRNISTAAGNFTTWKVKKVLPTSGKDSWEYWADGIGRVMFDRLSAEGWKKELESYIIN